MIGERTLIFMMVISTVLGYAFHKYTYPFIEKFFTGKDLAEVPDFQLMIAEREVPLEVLAEIGFRTKPEREKKEFVEKIPEKPPYYKLIFTLIGARKKYAIIDGRLFTEGDRISPYERVEQIREKKVLLSGKWGKRWLFIGD